MQFLKGLVALFVGAYLVKKIIYFGKVCLQVFYFDGVMPDCQGFMEITDPEELSKFLSENPEDFRAFLYEAKDRQSVVHLRSILDHQILHEHKDKKRLIDSILLSAQEDKSITVLRTLICTKGVELNPVFLLNKSSFYHTKWSRSSFANLLTGLESGGRIEDLSDKLSSLSFDELFDLRRFTAGRETEEERVILKFILKKACDEGLPKNLKCILHLGVSENLADCLKDCLEDVIAQDKPELFELIACKGNIKFSECERVSIQSSFKANLEDWLLTKAGQSWSNPKETTEVIEAAEKSEPTGLIDTFFNFFRSFYNLEPPRWRMDVRNKNEESHE